MNVDQVLAIGQLVAQRPNYEYFEEVMNAVFPGCSWGADTKTVAETEYVTAANVNIVTPNGAMVDLKWTADDLEGSGPVRIELVEWPHEEVESC